MGVIHLNRLETRDTTYRSAPVGDRRMRTWKERDTAVERDRRQIAATAYYCGYSRCCCAAAPSRTSPWQ